MMSRSARLVAISLALPLWLCATEPAEARRSANPEGRLILDAAVAPAETAEFAPEAVEADPDHRRRPSARGGGNPVSLPAGAELITVTTYDLQDMGSLGVRIIRESSGLTHVTFGDDFCELDANGCPPDLGAPNPFPERAMGYATRTAGGIWTNLGKVEDPSVRGCCVTELFGGFGAMDLTPDGRAVIAQHMNEDGCDARSCAYIQDATGVASYAANLSEITNPSYLFPQIAANDDGSFVMLSEIARFGTYDETENFRVAYLAGEGSAFTCPVGWQFDSWESVVDTTLFLDGNPAFPSMAKGADGRVGIAVGDFGGDVRLIESSDGSFGPGTITVTQITSYSQAAITAADSTSTEWRPYIHCDLAYDGTTPNIVWSELQGRRNGSNEVFYVDYRSRIQHWNPVSGITTVKQVQAGEADTYDEVDTGGVGPSAGFNSISVDWPQVGFDANGDVIVGWLRFVDAEVDPTADAGLPGIVNGIGYGDIAISTRSSGGSWSAPLNVTNTPTADERFFSLAKQNAAGKAAIVFQASATDEAGVTAIGDRGIDPVVYERRVAYLEVDLSPSTSAPQLVAADSGLLRSVPNPSSSAVQFQFTGDQRFAGQDVEIFAVDGSRVRTLPSPAGMSAVAWDGRDETGSLVAPGVYFARVQIGDRQLRTKVLRTR